MSLLTPKQLDAQSNVRIDHWVEMHSEEWRELDDMPDFTKKIIRLGFQEPAFLFTDSLGRIFGKGNNVYYPLHFERYGKIYGYRISKLAAN